MISHVIWTPAPIVSIPSVMIWKLPNEWSDSKFSFLLQCADTGYHTTLGRVMQAYLSRRWKAQDNLSTGLQQIEEAVSRLDQSRDRDILLQDNYNTFSMPLRFPYQPHDGDQVCILIKLCKGTLYIKCVEQL